MYTVVPSYSYQPDFKLNNEKHTVINKFKIPVFILSSVCLVTIIALYSVWLRFQVDDKFYKIEAMKKSNIKLQADVEKMEADVGKLKSFENIEKQIKSYNLDLDVPETAIYIDIKTTKTNKVYANNKIW